MSHAAIGIERATSPWLDRYRDVRARTVALTASLSPEDCALQSMADASPAKWHLAHTSWFFETFVLRRYLPGYAPYDARYAYLFNSYYDSVGARQPRAERGLLTRPAPATLLPCGSQATPQGWGSSSDRSLRRRRRRPSRSSMPRRS